MNKRIIVIGSGFSSLSAATYLAEMGNDVTVIEKNETVGGRARQLKKEGFTFDIGPTFYWMPDVFESYFNDFGKQVSDYYELKRLDPSYRVYFAEHDYEDLPANFDELVETFENIEPGSGKKLKIFLKDAKSNYDLAIKDLVYQPGNSIFEIVTPKTAKKLNLFIDSIQDQVFRRFKNPKLRKILNFPVLFLGAKPSDTPAFYDFMNYADMKLGTWQPKGGMYSVVEGMKKLAEEKGVKFHTNENVTSFDILGKEITHVVTDKNRYPVDVVMSGADYAFTETLLPEELRQYSEKYWKSRIFAPSALLYYVGFDKKLSQIQHHTLFFDTDFNAHTFDIYDYPAWPKAPLFYASFPSQTDDFSVPDKTKEAAIFLIPIAINLEDDPTIRDFYFGQIIDRLEHMTGQKLRDHILFHESYCVEDFKSDYNSYGGNAYGLANTLFQTHIFRPKIKSKKVKNLYFAGQLTVPGPGVPPSLISGKIVSNEIKKYEGKV